MDISYKYKSIAISSFKWQFFSRSRGVVSSGVRGGVFLENFQNGTWGKKSPLKNPPTISSRVGDISYYFGALTGFALHFVKDKNELLVGAPGVYNYVGTVVKFNNIEKASSEWEYEVMNPQGNFNEFTGYAITSGYFYKKNHQLYYVTGLPRGHKKTDSALGIVYGSVLVFNFTNDALRIKDQYSISLKVEFYGTQFGEYFGASLAAGDLNGDNLDDLIVGAPYRTNDKNGYNHGSVYVIYGHKKTMKLETRNRIDGTVTNALFGLAVAFLGNLDNDGSGEFAVSAPQEETSGVVYIYTYEKRSKRLEVSQRIVGKLVDTGLRGFGMSFSRPHDIDDNRYLDILIGAPLSGHSVLLRSKPTVSIETSIKVEPTISKSNQTLDFKCCYSYSIYPENTMIIIRKLIVDSDYNPSRFLFEPKSDKYTDEKEIRMQKNRPSCEQITVFKASGVTNYNDSISIILMYRIPENATADIRRPVIISSDKSTGNDVFCKKCPVLKPKSLESETKVVMWDQLCGGQVCIAELVTRAGFTNLSKENTYVLGTKEYLSLEVTVENKNDSAFTPSLEISFPNGVYLRRGPISCRNSDIGKITCDLGEELVDQVTLNYEFNIDEGLSESELSFFLNSSTTTLSYDARNTLNLTLHLEREAEFQITGESRESTYVYTRGENVSLQNTFKIEKMGPSPVPEIELSIRVPYAMKDAAGIFRKFATIQEFQDAGNRLAKCQTVENEESTLVRVRKNVDLAKYDVGNTMNDSTPPVFIFPNVMHINCSTDSVKCALIKCLVGPFENVQKYAEVVVDMKANFKSFDDMLNLNESIVLATSATIVENITQSGNRSDTIFNIIKVDREFIMPIWIPIASAVVGLIILVILSICLAKAGFFERKDKMKLLQLKEEACEQDRLMEEMMEREGTNEIHIEENTLYGDIARNPEQDKELVCENSLYGHLLTGE